MEVKCQTCGNLWDDEYDTVYECDICRYTQCGELCTNDNNSYIEIDDHGLLCRICVNKLIKKLEKQLRNKQKVDE